MSPPLLPNMNNIADLLHAHGDTLAGSAVGLFAGLGVTTGAIPLPEGSPDWLKIAGPLLGALAPFLIGLVRSAFRGGSAGDRLRAAQLRTKAGKLRQKGDEAGAVALEDEADALDVKATEKDAVLGRGFALVELLGALAFVLALCFAVVAFASCATNAAAGCPSGYAICSADGGCACYVEPPTGEPSEP